MPFAIKAHLRHLVVFANIICREGYERGKLYVRRRLLMELLYYIFLIFFIIFLNIALYLPGYFTVSEEEITENLRSLKRQSWFQQLLQDESHSKLIVHDKDVRNVIGKFNSKRIQVLFFQRRYEKRLQRVLQGKNNVG